MTLSTIFIAEDSRNVRDNLHKIITQIEGLEIIGESSNLKDSMQFMSNENPDVCLIDIGLEDGSGIELLKFIKSKNNATVAIVFTNYISPPYEIICRKLGADYFLDKTKDLDKLIELLQKRAL